jgi:hypothetical protein
VCVCVCVWRRKVRRNRLSMQRTRAHAHAHTHTHTHTHKYNTNTHYAQTGGIPARLYEIILRAMSSWHSNTKFFAHFTTYPSWVSWTQQRAQRRLLPLLPRDHISNTRESADRMTIRSDISLCIHVRMPRKKKGHLNAGHECLHLYVQGLDTPWDMGSRQRLSAICVCGHERERELSVSVCCLCRDWGLCQRILSFKHTRRRQQPPVPRRMQALPKSHYSSRNRCTRLMTSRLSGAAFKRPMRTRCVFTASWCCNNIVF